MKLRRIKTLQSMRRLTVVFALPPLRDDFRASPLTVLEYLLGHKGRDSLISLLVARGLAVDLRVKRRDVSDLFTYLEVSFDLTREGFARHQDVVRRLFEYMRMVSVEGLSAELVQEIRTVLNLQYSFADKLGGLRKAVRAAQRLGVYPPHLVNRIGYLMGAVDAARFRGLVDSLRLQSAIITLETDEFGQLAQRDPYFGTSFQDEPLDADFVESLDAILRSGSPAPVIKETAFDSDFGLSLPERNSFIPEDFRLVNPQDPSTRPKPRLVHTTPNSELFFLADTVFGLPKVVFNTLIYLPFERFLGTPLNRAALAMFVALLQQHLKEFLATAALAQIKAELQLTETGLQLSSAGFSHKFGAFLEEFARRIADFCEAKPGVESFVEAQFGALRKSKLEELDRQTKQQPSKQYNLTKAYLLQPGTLSPAQLTRELRQLTLAEYLRVHRSALQRVYLESYVGGNLREPDAVALQAGFVSGLHRGGLFMALPLRSLGQSRVVSFAPQQIAIFEKELLNPAETNGLVSVYFQLPQGEPAELINLLLRGFLKKAFFRDMRSRRRLGHVAAAFSNLRKGVPSFSFLVQSAKRLPSELAQEIYGFIARQTTRIERLGDAQFERLRKGQLAFFEDEFKSLERQADFFFRQIKSHQYNFDKRSKSIARLKRFRKEDLVEHFDRVFFGEPRVLEFHFVTPQSARANRDHIAQRQASRSGEFGGLRIESYSSAEELQKDHSLYADVERKIEVYTEL